MSGPRAISEGQAPADLGVYGLSRKGRQVFGRAVRACDRSRRRLCGLRPMVYGGAGRREGYATTKSATFAGTIVIRRRLRAPADVGISIAVLSRPGLLDHRTPLRLQT